MTNNELPAIVEVEPIESESPKDDGKQPLPQLSEKKNVTSRTYDNLPTGWYVPGAIDPRDKPEPGPVEREQRGGRDLAVRWDLYMDVEVDPKLLSDAEREGRELAARSRDQEIVKESVPPARSAGSRHVRPGPDGGWDIIGAAGDQSVQHSDSRAEAVRLARKIVQSSGGGEVVIHDQVGPPVEPEPDEIEGKPTQP